MSKEGIEHVNLPKVAKLTKSQQRMKKATAYMKGYMAEYHKQFAYMDYSEETFIDDVLYGLGVALHGTAVSYAAGYEVWKTKLLEHMQPNVLPHKGGA